MSFLNSIYEWMYAPDSLMVYFEDSGIFIIITSILILLSVLNSFFYYWIWQPDSNKRFKWFLSLLLSCVFCFLVNIGVSLLILDIELTGLWVQFFSFFLTTPFLYSAVLFIVFSFVMKNSSPATYNMPI